VRTSHRPGPPANVAEMVGEWSCSRQVGEPERLRVPAEQPFCRPRQQALASAVHQPQASLRVEREDGDGNLFHHGAQQARRVERAHALRPQRVGERVHLGQDLAERIVAP
jgi:hypothetical protein